MFNPGASGGLAELPGTKETKELESGRGFSHSRTELKDVH